MINKLSDEDILHHSMVNAYKLLTKKELLEDLIDLDEGIFPFNPTIKIEDDSVYDKIIDYFCELEEYEKCQEILNIKNKKK
jgi:hypothetical protein